MLSPVEEQALGMALYEHVCMDMHVLMCVCVGEKVSKDLLSLVLSLPTLILIF